MYKDPANPEARQYYDEQFCKYLEQGYDPGEAAERADMDLLKWSEPIPLPHIPEALWSDELTD